MANSINTNYGAQIALQNLNATNKALETTQNRVNTGQKVSSAKDNGAIWAVAQTLRADMGALDAVQNSIQRGRSVVDVGLAAGDTIMAALSEMKALAVAIEAGTAAGEDTTAYETDMTALAAEITAAHGAAKFDDVNAFAVSTGGVRTGLDSASTVDLGVAYADPALTSASTADDVQAAIDGLATVMQELGTQSKTLDRQLTFNTKLQDAMETGIGNLVDADLAKESARLTALQTKQQLGVQALSIANQSSSMLLGLFR
ncbi:flagellin [Brevundimonas naejangsanensis]|uniref:Flagellin n=1 Tax=Brevundimonas naejangsanensis TaxID=588932 RepID=A0A494REJ9_9CAUL|nr:flagellin [Brevundimonas naejangsanensis]AYG93819.1 flagellin [Brevundimonas naejangsanensis]